MIHNAGRFKASRKTLAIYIIFIAIGGISFIVSLFADVSICLIYNVTGIPCFSCGMTRAFGSLPNIRRALAYHPMFFTVPFIPLLMLVPVKIRNIAAALFIVLLIGIWVIRMILLFPYYEPMIYNENSLFEYIRNVLL
ncbi:MAG: DUF2752 domain-containing protein [Defluviitaleaceae bacterium]|nr:DUF2752 domain-containing protein [Defluviitaleaceae bacterium]